MQALPECGFVRLKDIIGDRRADPPIPALVPVSKSTLWAAVKDGTFPQPTRALGKRITAWAVSDIRAYLDAAALPAIDSQGSRAVAGAGKEHGSATGANA